MKLLLMNRLRGQLLRRQALICYNLLLCSNNLIQYE